MGLRFWTYYPNFEGCGIWSQTLASAYFANPTRLIIFQQNAIPSFTMRFLVQQSRVMTFTIMLRNWKMGLPTVALSNGSIIQNLRTPHLGLSVNNRLWKWIMGHLALHHEHRPASMTTMTNRMMSPLGQRPPDHTNSLMSINYTQSCMVANRMMSRSR